MAEQVLVVYFSHSGNTRKIANLIHKEVGGNIHEIQPESRIPIRTMRSWSRQRKKYRRGTNLY